jgi:hypothetical protein
MATILCETAVVTLCEGRHNRCGLCGLHGHNRRTCPSSPTTEKSSAKSTPSPAPQQEVTYWTPELFSGGGVRSLPAAVAWAPGTDSIAFSNQMKSLPFYSYDAAAKLWRRA